MGAVELLKEDIDEMFRHECSAGRPFCMLRRAILVCDDMFKDLRIAATEIISFRLMDPGRKFSECIGRLCVRSVKAEQMSQILEKVSEQVSHASRGRLYVSMNVFGGEHNHVRNGKLRPTTLRQLGKECNE